MRFGKLLAWSLLLTSWGIAVQPQVIASATQQQSSGASWLLKYRDQSTNAVRWAPELPNLLNHSLPNVSVPSALDEPAPKTALNYLSGGPDPVLIESNRFVTLAAVSPAEGWDRGLLWVDTGRAPSPTIFAALSVNPAHAMEASLLLYTRSANYMQALPPQFVASLSSWIARNRIRQLTDFSITGSDATAHKLSPGLLGL